MINFKDWFYSQESSASTRARNAAFLGLGPKIASPFSHSTPSPAMVDKLLDDLKPKKKKKKKKKKKLHENKSKTPDYSFDTFVKRMIQLEKDIKKDLKDADAKDKDLDAKEKDLDIKDKEKDKSEEMNKKKKTNIDKNKEKIDNE